LSSPSRSETKLLIPASKIHVPLGPSDTDVAFQEVGVGEAVGREITVVGHPFDLEGQVDAAPDIEGAVGEDMAADVVVRQVVPGERSGGLDPSGAEGLPVAQLDRLAVAEPDPRRHRQVAVIAQHDEIGHADLGAGGVGGPHRGREEPGRAFQRRVGHAHLRQPEHRHAHDAELRAFEVELLFHLVVDDPAGADFPKRRGVVETHLAGRRDSLVGLAVAAIHAVDLGGGDLQLPVEDEARGLQDAVPQIGGEIGEIGDDDGVARGIDQGQGALDRDLVAAPRIGDRLRPEPRALEEDLDAAARGDRGGPLVEGDVVGDERGGRALGNSGKGGCQPCQPRDKRRGGHPSRASLDIRPATHLPYATRHPPP
jgi:hypothetical protein